LKRKKKTVSRRAFESRLNILLSELLNERGIISRSEIISTGRRDLVVYHQGLVCVLEGSYSKNDAERDAKLRIEQLSADIALAVHYNPEVFHQDLSELEIKKRLSTTSLPVRVIVPEDISETLLKVLYGKNVIATPLSGWYDLDINSLIVLLQEVGQFILSEEAIKKISSEVDDLINTFVEFLSHHRGSDTIARNLYNVLYKLYGFSIGKPENIKEAIFAQSILAILLSCIYYETVRYAHNLRPLKGWATNPHTTLLQAFNDILSIDYREIFETSKEMLNFFPPSERFFEHIIDIATKIASRKALLRRDFAGRIYHKTVGEWSLKKGLATYYTEIPAAYLLAFLGKPSLSNICDFASGSGTLLVATYSAASSSYRLSLLRNGIEKDPRQIETEFHKKFIESCYGFDVLSYATQITAINLALHSPETPLERFCIFTIPLGAKDGDISLGSLELAKKHGSILDRLKAVQQRGLDDKQVRFLEEIRKIQPFDFIIMNPPFTRATGRGGRKGGGLFGFIADQNIRAAVIKEYTQFRKEVRNELISCVKGYLKNSGLDFLLKDKDFASYKSIGQAGEGLLFVYLADVMVKNNGKICFVLPKNFLSGTSWFLMRALIASKYHLESVVVSYDSDHGYNFSESTDMSECLIVARKTLDISTNTNTQFIILLKKPETSVEAIALTNKLEDSESKQYIESGKAAAFVVKVKQDKLQSCLDNWGRFVFLPDPGVLNLVENILEGTIEIGRHRKKVPLTRLNNLIKSIGIDRHQFSDNFKNVSKQVPGSKAVVYGGKESSRKTMEIKPNAYVLPRNKGRSLFQEKAGRLLVPDRIRVDTAHVISMICTENVLSNIFYALKLKEENIHKLKALCLWLNTTWGVLTVLANKQETEGGWISLKISQWRLLPVLNVDQLSDSKLKLLSTIYDKFKRHDMGRLPKQYRPQSWHIRGKLDTEFLNAMDIQVSPESLCELYEQISAALRQWLGGS